MSFGDPQDKLSSTSATCKCATRVYRLDKNDPYSPMNTECACNKFYIPIPEMGETDKLKQEIEALKKSVEELKDEVAQMKKQSPTRTLLLDSTSNV